MAAGAEAAWSAFAVELFACVGTLDADEVGLTGGREGAAAFVEPGAVGGLACGFTGAGMGFFPGGRVVLVCVCGLMGGGAGFFAVVCWGFSGVGTGFLVGRVVVVVLVDIVMAVMSGLRELKCWY